MYLCYLDESGVPEIPGNSTHFVLAGIAIPIERWREADAAITEIMARYGLAGAELHTAWLLRKYLEQSKIPDFDSLDWDERRKQVLRLRVAEVHRVRKLGIAKRNSQLKKIYRHTDPYIHLSFRERTRLAVEIAEAIAKWDWAVLIAECIDKSYFLTKIRRDHVNESAFRNIITSFDKLLQIAEGFNFIEEDDTYSQTQLREHGLLIHDNNATVALKHTRHMRTVHADVLRWGMNSFDRIIETPLFVDSSLKRMIQLADLWAYSLRRYVENEDSSLFSLLYSKRTLLGRTQHEFRPAIVQHLAEQSCPCMICTKKFESAK
jgi:hypothetical protein